jgi:hypothetical protein
LLLCLPPHAAPNHKEKKGSSVRHCSCCSPGLTHSLTQVPTPCCGCVRGSRLPWLIRAGRLRNLAGRRQGGARTQVGWRWSCLPCSSSRGELVGGLVGYAGCGLMTLMRGSRLTERCRGLRRGWVMGIHSSGRKGVKLSHTDRGSQRRSGEEAELQRAAARRWALCGTGDGR